MDTMTSHDQPRNEYKIVCYHCSSIQNYTLKDINKFPKRPKKLCSNCKKTIYLEIGIEDNKIMVKPIKDLIIEDLTIQLNNLKTSKTYTNSPLKEPFHDDNNDNSIEDTYKHFFTIFNSFPSLPLFLYSEVSNKFISRCDNKCSDWNRLSFYDVYMNVINDICNKKLDDKIMEYEGNTLQLYGNTVCQEMYDVDFDQEILEKVTYLPEDQYQEKLDAYIDDYFKEQSEERQTKMLKLYKESLRERITEGSYIEDYSYVLEIVENYIKSSVELVNELYKTIRGLSLKAFKTIRSRILFFIFFDLDESNSFKYRNQTIMKEDIKKIVLEHNSYNNKKESFVECVRWYNEASIGYKRDEMTITIEKDCYIDLGTHGKEYLGIQEFREKVNGNWKTKEYFFDTIKIE